MADVVCLVEVTFLFRRLPHWKAHPATFPPQKKKKTRVRFKSILYKKGVGNSQQPLDSLLISCGIHWFMEVSYNGGTCKSIRLNKRFQFHYKPPILGIPHDLGTGSSTASTAQRLGIKRHVQE